MERLSNLLKDNSGNDDSDNTVRLSVEIYKNDSKYSVHIAHDGCSGVKYNNVSTSADVASCVEDYLDSNF